MSDKHLFEPREGYEAAAASYGTWRWSQLWDHFEVPVVVPSLQKVALGTILDAGCGLGRYRPIIRNEGRGYVGMDFSRAMLAENLRLAAYRNEASGALLLGDVRCLPFRSASIEGLLCARVLSHVDAAGLEAALHEFARVLKPGGLSIITDVDWKHPYENIGIDSEAGKIFVKTFKHSPKEVQDKALEAGMQIAEFRRYTMADIARHVAARYMKPFSLTSETPLFYSCLLRKR